MKTQEKILIVVEQFLNEKKYSPSIREIMAAVGLKSTATVHGHLQRLRDKGLLDWKENCRRTLTVKKPREGQA